MRVVKLKARNVLPDEEADALAGTFLTEDSYDTLVAGEETRVLRPDGSLLLHLASQALTGQHCRLALPVMRAVIREMPSGGNRGLAGGKVDPAKVRADHRRQGYVLDGTGLRYYPIRQDGVVSNTHFANEVDSTVIGFYDRYERFPYCRQTQFNVNHPDMFSACMPFIRAVNDVFWDRVPDRHSAQMQVVEKTSPDFVISRTAFTTITVNRNWQTAVHKDAGDLKEGFGVMSALRSGKFKGCYLVFPKYRVAVDMRTRDVLLADVHEWHGNTPILGAAYERISLVFYYRENMKYCGTAAQELELAKSRKRGDALRKVKPS